MSLEDSSKQNPNLSEFDTMWREQKGRNFYAIICETLGDNKEAYRELTTEMIEESQERNPKRVADEIKEETINGILSSLDSIVTDAELCNNEERMERAHAGMLVWLRLLKEQLQ